MERVERLIADTIDRFEGGYTDYPADRGGPTNRGITQRVYAAHLGRPVSVEEVRAMPREHAVAIYRDRYWERPKIGLLPEALQPVVFDMAVNMGPEASVRLLQETLADFGQEVTVDGALGPVTAAAAGRAIADPGVRVVLDRICDRRRDRYLAIIARDPAQAVFRRGWLARCDHFRPPGDGT